MRRIGFLALTADRGGVVTEVVTRLVLARLASLASPVSIASGADGSGARKVVADLQPDREALPELRGLSWGPLERDLGTRQVTSRTTQATTSTQLERASP
jgi:hypothetical protein